MLCCNISSSVAFLFIDFLLIDNVISDLSWPRRMLNSDDERIAVQLPNASSSNKV